MGRGGARAGASAFRSTADPRSGSLVVPSETTIRRTLNKVDADALDAQVGAWLLAQAGYGSEEACGEEMVVAVDGGTARGTRQAGGTAPHFLAAITCSETAVIAQQQVDAKTNSCRTRHEMRSPRSLQFIRQANADTIPTSTAAQAAARP